MQIFSYLNEDSLFEREKFHFTINAFMLLLHKINVNDYYENTLAESYWVSLYTKISA